MEKRKQTFWPTQYDYVSEYKVLTKGRIRT